MKIRLLSLLIGISLSAQQLSIEEAITKVLHTHPDIKKFVLHVSQSQSRVAMANADYLPQININAEYDATKTYVFPTNGVFNTKESDGWQVGAQLSQKIWDFSKTTANIDAKNESVKISKLSLEDTKAYLAYKVKVQYELILVNQEAVDVRIKDLESKEALYKQAKAFVKEGLKTSADASRFLSSFYIAQDNLAIAQANLEKACNTLSVYIGEKVPSDVKLQTYDAALGEIDVKMILNKSLSLQVLQREIKKSNLDYKSLQASHYGSIDAIASFTHQNTLSEYDSQLIGLTVNIPIYSGGRISAQVEEAKLERQTQQEEYNSQKLLLQDEVEAILIDIKRYEKTIQSKKAQLVAARDTSNILDARYQEGLATYIEVLDAIALKLDAKLGLLSAYYERSSMIHKLEYLQGKI